MNRSRLHDHLTSFAVSAMITASFLATAPAAAISAAAGPQPAAVMNALEGLRAAGWHGLQDAAPPAAVADPKSAPNAPVADEKPLLSDAQIQKLTALLAKYGVDAPIEPYITEALGLTVPGEHLIWRQLNTPYDGHVAHLYHRTRDGGYLLSAVYFKSARSFRANAKQELVAALDAADGLPPVVIPVADAQKELKAEFAFWAATADKF